jgi:hypothetical protein
MEFQISAKAKKTIFGVIGVGLLAFIIGIVKHSADPQFGTRIMSNFLIDGFFFFAIALGALFFLALQYATETGWSVAVKRVVEGIASYVIVGIGILLAVFLVLNDDRSSVPEVYFCCSFSHNCRSLCYGLN